MNIPKPLNKPNVVSEVYNKEKVEMQLLRELRFDMQTVSDTLKDWSFSVTKGKTGGEMVKEVRVMRKLIYKFSMQWRREKVLAFFRQILKLHTRFMDLMVSETLAELIDLIPRSCSSSSTNINLPSITLTTHHCTIITVSLSILAKSLHLCVLAAKDIRKQISAGLFVHYMLVCLAAVSKYFSLCRSQHDSLQRCLSKMLHFNECLKIALPSSSSSSFSSSSSSTAPSIASSSTTPTSTLQQENEERLKSELEGYDRILKASSFMQCEWNTATPVSTTASTGTSSSSSSTILATPISSAFSFTKSTLIFSPTSFPISSTTAGTIPPTTPPTTPLTTYSNHLLTSSSPAAVPDQDMEASLRDDSDDVFLDQVDNNKDDNEISNENEKVKEKKKSEKVKKAKIRSSKVTVDGLVKRVQECSNIGQLEGVVRAVSGGTQASKVCLRRLQVMKEVRRKLKEGLSEAAEKSGKKKRKKATTVLSSDEKQQVARLKLGGLVEKCLQMSDCTVAGRLIVRKCKSFVTAFLHKHLA